MPAGRTSYLPEDSWGRASSMAFDNLLDDGLSTLRFQSSLAPALHQLNQIGVTDDDTTDEDWQPTTSGPRPMPMDSGGPLELLPIPRMEAPSEPEVIRAPQSAGSSDISPPAPAAPVSSSVGAGLPSAAPGAAPSSAPGAAPTIAGRNPAVQARIYQQARASGRSDEDARILVAVSETEAGMEGQVGDNGQSHGVYQFHDRGEKPAFRAWLRKNGIEGDPNQLAVDPEIATRYAAEGYLGQAIDRGRALGYSGAELATYVQRTGQRSVDPAKTGANYTRLFGQGAPAAPGPVSSPTVSPTQVASEDRAQSGETRTSLTGITPPQFGLGDADADAICGPVLAMAFARANGRPATIAEAKQMAAQNGGWTSARGMGGPEAMANTLRAMKIPATYKPGPLDIETIRRETAGGNPVGINTSGHYFVVEGVDAQGRLDLGNSARALRASGGRQWFRPDEIEGLGMGAPTGAIYKDSPSSPVPSVAVRETGMPTVSAPNVAASPLAAAAPQAPAGIASPAGAPDMLRQSLSSDDPDEGPVYPLAPPLEVSPEGVPIYPHIRVGPAREDPDYPGYRHPFDVPPGAMYRQPLADTAPTISDTRAADEGPREQPYPGTVAPIVNPDRSVTTERSITVTDLDLNGGLPTNIPTVWSGRIVSDDEAITNAINSRRPWPSYRTIDEAETAAQQRSLDLGTGRATSVGGAAVPTEVQNAPINEGGLQYRQPLGQTGLQDLPYDPRDEDQGAHELPATTYNDPTAAGTVSQPLQNPIIAPTVSPDTPVLHTSGVGTAAPSDPTIADPVYTRPPTPSPSWTYGPVDTSGPEYGPPAAPDGIDWVTGARNLGAAAWENVIRPAMATLDAANEWAIRSPLGNVNLQGLGRELQGWEQIEQEVGEDTRRLQALVARRRAGDTSADDEIAALTASLKQRMRVGQDIRQRALEAGERNPNKTAETMGGLAQGALATALAPSLGSGVVRNVAAAALDPVGQATGAALEAPGHIVEVAAPVIRRGAEALEAGARGLGTRVSEGLAANAAQTAAADARMARQGSTALPGTLGVITDNPLEAGRAARGRIVPPDVADQLDFPVRVPDDPATIRAIEAAGGTVDPERGVTLNVIRYQGPEAHGGTATRGSTFYTAGTPGASSSYATSTNNPHAVGGTERIEGPTRFRSPLIISDAPGEARGFNEGMQQIGVTEHPDVARAIDAVKAAYRERAAAIERSSGPSREFYDRPENRSLNSGASFADTPEGAVFAQETRRASDAYDAAIRDYDRLRVEHPTITAENVEKATRGARSAGPEGSPERAQALKDLVSKYGGDPDLIDDLLAIRGADASESAWAIKENILAANARKQGYDGVVTVQPHGPDETLVEQHPKVVAASKAIDEANAAYLAAADELRAAEKAAMGPFSQRPGEPFSEYLKRNQNVGSTPEYRAAQDAAEREPRLIAARAQAERVFDAQDAAEKAYSKAQDEARAAIGTHRITELADVREGRNPTPGAPNPAISEATAAYERALQAAAYKHPTSPEVQELMRAHDALKAAEQTPHVGEPGYALREDIPRRPDTRASTIAENPRLAEAERALDAADKRSVAAYEAHQAAEAAHQAKPNAENWRAFQAAETELQSARAAWGEVRAAFDAASGEGRYVTANAGAGTIPASAPTDRLAAMNRLLGQGAASTVSGGVGAQVNQEMNPDDPNAALKGFAAGALVPPLAARGAGRLARAAGREAEAASGAMGVFGFGGRPANEAASAAPNPTMQRMARQMAGQHTPSGVTNTRGLAERWAQAWTDDRAGIRTFQEAVSHAIGRPLTAGESVAELTRVNPASVASQRLDEGLKTALQNVGDDEDYLAQYLVHRHNVDVARAMGQRAYDAAIAAGISPQLATRRATAAANARQFSGELRLTETLQQLQDIEQRVTSLPEGADRWQAIQDGAQAVWDTNRQTLERKRDAGIISDELYTDLSTTYPHYVRTDIADYFDKGSGGPAPAGKRLGLSDIGIQKLSAEGTTKERVNPLLSTIDATYSAESAIARNTAGKAFEELIRLDPSWQSTFKEVVPAQGVNRGNPATTVSSSHTLKNGEQYLRVWSGGQARTYVIPQEYAAMVSPQTGRILGDSGAAQSWQTAMNAYKSLITSKNPAFSMLVSPIRDAGDYAIREGALSATKGGPVGLAQGAAGAVGAMGDYVKAIPNAFAGILEGTYKGDLAAMMREGAGQISRPGREQGDLRSALRDLQRTGGLEVKSAGDVARLVGNVLTLGAEPIGGRIEQIPRLAAARRAERRGAQPLGQAMAFRDATVDFQRAGEWSRVVNSVVPFFNVAVQGGAQTVRTARQNPAAFMGAVAATVGTATMAAEAWNNSDEQRKADYDDAPDYLKKTGIVIMLPGVDGQSERGDRLPNYAWIPVGQYGALVQTAKEAAKNYASGQPGADLGTPQGWGQLGAEVAGIFSPIRGDSAGSVLSSVVPPGLSTGVELAANTDLFRGSTIATDRRDENAAALSQGSATAFNAVTGQETRPSQWDYLYRDLGGYGATLALEGSNLLAEKLGMRQPKAEDRPIQNAPIAGGLVNRVVRDTGGQRLQEATEDSVRVPESIRPILQEAGVRREELLPVPSKLHGGSLTREEQERWQVETNDLMERYLDRAQRDPKYRNPTTREQVVREAMAKARDDAEKRARLPSQYEMQRRLRDEQRRKAG